VARRADAMARADSVILVERNDLDLGSAQVHANAQPA
jgi:hypothetical protein